MNLNLSLDEIIKRNKNKSQNYSNIKRISPLQDVIKPNAKNLLRRKRVLRNFKAGIDKTRFNAVRHFKNKINAKTSSLNKYRRKNGEFGAIRQKRSINMLLDENRDVDLKPIKRRISIEDARLKIIQSIKNPIPLPNNFSTLNEKPMDARMRIEARKSEKQKQSTEKQPVIRKIIPKGILHRSVNTYIDRDFALDVDDNIDFSRKTIRNNKNNDYDDNYDIDMSNMIINNGDTDDDDDDDDEFDDTDEEDDNDVGNVNKFKSDLVMNGKDFHLLCRTITNDTKKIPRKSILLRSSLVSRSLSNNKIKDEPNYSDVKRTIENVGGPLKFNKTVLSKSSEQKDILDLSKKPMESSKSSINSRLGKKTTDSDGCRIIVSNLHANVTSEDIKELFEDIGSLLSAVVMKPGTAEVVYKLQEDATKAVDVYHNRQLDGQPMKCVLVKPSISASEHFANNKNSNLPPILPDPVTIRKALFSS